MRTSVETAVLELRRAALLRPPKVPAHIELRPAERPHWDAILRERPFDEWDEVLLPMVATMARLSVEIEREQARLRDEGAVIHYPNGIPRTNPRAALITDKIRMLVAMRRTLGISAAPRPRRKR